MGYKKLVIGQIYEEGHERWNDSFYLKELIVAKNG
jgi:hypothetical protein